MKKLCSLQPLTFKKYASRISVMQKRNENCLSYSNLIFSLSTLLIKFGMFTGVTFSFMPLIGAVFLIHPIPNDLTTRSHQTSLFTQPNLRRSVISLAFPHLANLIVCSVALTRFLFIIRNTLLASANSPFFAYARIRRL